jgi:hypothetical protein
MTLNTCKKVRRKANEEELHWHQWLTGYDKSLQKQIDSATFETFPLKCAKINPNAKLITGVICRLSS